MKSTTLLRLPGRTSAWAVLLVVLVSGVSARSSEPKDATKPGGHAYDPSVSSASPDAARAMAGFRVPDGLKLELFAAEPLLANPVVFSFDEKGRVYVVETFRLHKGVTDNRGHMNWLDADLASRTVEDRVAMYRKFLGKEAETYAQEHDRIRLLEDRDGDGKPDHATVFADGWNGMADGLAAGILARKGDVYFANIPSLWLLRDNDGDGKADARKALQTGYGVHVGFLGHDLHGLRFGPDGKLYFSIGDRGLNITSSVDGRKLSAPDTGSVLRCEPDGSHLEIFATGLRNPQELAFDEFGNLFTVDNNSDSGDKARLVYVIEGGDSGWQMGFQYIEEPVSRGPWNAEKIWHPQWDGQVAYIVPPLANISDGPSGLTYNPGSTLLPDRLKRHFFLADFRGASNTSGLRTFSVKPKGAGFTLGDSEQFVWGVLATDVDFGPDGALYVSDWVEGWNLTGKGRIYRIADPKVSPASATDVKQQLAKGFDGRSPEELTGLLAHADQRVRQEAQFALASRNQSDPLRSVALDRSANQLARIHAIWGLGQISRKTPASAEPLRALLTDADAEVRAQAARTLGEAREVGALPGLTLLLRDDSPRVRSFAAIALGKIPDKTSVEPLLQVLRENADRDVFLRHAAVMGLSTSARAGTLAHAIADPSRSVRMGALLALRRQTSPEIARFLKDSDATIVAEAARAIHDVPIDAAMPALAKIAEHPGLDQSTLRRVVNAVRRAGLPDGPAVLAQLAARPDVPEPVGIEAIDVLSKWETPIGRDRVTGLWRPSVGHPSGARIAAEALEKVLPALLNGRSEAKRRAALRAAGPLPLSRSGAAIAAIATDPKQWALTRAEALKALDRLKDSRLPDLILKAVNDSNPSLRIEGQRLLAKLRPNDAIPLFTTVLDSGSILEKQGALATLATMPPGAADKVLLTCLNQLKEGKLPPEVELDLLDAARKRKSIDIQRSLQTRDSALSGTNDPVASFHEALVGGDAERGAKVLNEKAEVSCVRCHKINGQGGEVGPDLTGIGKRQDRRYLLESIVAPNKQVAKGFETLLIATDDGAVVSGIVKEDTETSLRLMTADGKLQTIPKDRIEEQKRGASAMPDDLVKHLSRSEIRDLVEYLSSLK